jgi:hypothetical protein
MPEIARDDPGTAGDVRGAWVAVDEADVLVAYLTSRVVDGCAHIEQVSVRLSHARRGIGAALIDHLGASVTLTTFREVPWNAPYYARLGFEVVPSAEQGPELGVLSTRERNRTREKASERGTKSAASRQGNEARAGATQAKRSASSAATRSKVGKK